jgi:8-oxo-dGTP pyrophosphatase MutT (NUDIX family)
VNKAEFLERFHHLRQVLPEPDFSLEESGNPAAVLIPLMNYPDTLKILLTERAHHLRHHPGQVSFPGGKVETSDLNIESTALREAYEEVALPPNKVEIIGSLPIYRTISGFTIKPILGLVEPDFTPSLDANEVASVFEIPLNYALDQKHHLVYFSHYNGARHPIYFIPWRDRMIWGATASIIRTLSNHIHP